MDSLHSSPASMAGLLFPHEKVRDEQKKLIADVQAVLEKKMHLIAHAPTGLGKTAAVLAPALSCALAHPGVTVFFLTARHTQHRIALDTLRQIKQRHNQPLVVCDVIGKKHMCSQPGAALLSSSDFSEFCKKVREEKTCEFYMNCRGGKASQETRLTVQGEKVLSELQGMQPCSAAEAVEICTAEKVCPYELTLALAKKAHVVIADYSYIFHPAIRDSFLGKTGKELCNCIIIVDEGHNLPSRIRDLMTEKVSSYSIRYAITEAKKFGYTHIVEQLAGLQNVFLAFAEKVRGAGKNEMLVSRQEFIDAVQAIGGYDGIVSDYKTISDAIRGVQRRSFIGSIGSFLGAWRNGHDEGFARIFSLKQGFAHGRAAGDEMLMLSYRCLDPSLMARQALAECYAGIIMSGTLSPTGMYRDVLGYAPERCLERMYGDPFIEDNRLALVIPETTTKYALRSEGQFRRMAEICGNIVRAVPGNCAIFFPSYDIRNRVHQFLHEQCGKMIFVEQPGMSSVEKAGLLENFKRQSTQGGGAVLLGAISGSFAEGIDLPGDLLKGVIVVGLPLSQPDVETQELIKYYDAQFGRGWDYGYIFPAFIKCLQGAGRCIRTETDRGVVVFLDERYVWPRYARCFPEDYGVRVAQDAAAEIEEFFG